MTQNELVSAVAAEVGIQKKEVLAVLKAVEKAVLDNDKVPFGNLGSFKTVVKKGRPARTGRNPKTGQPITIAATSDSEVLKFAVAKQYR